MPAATAVPVSTLVSARRSNLNRIVLLATQALSLGLMAAWVTIPAGALILHRAVRVGDVAVDIHRRCGGGCRGQHGALGRTQTLPVVVAIRV